MTMRFVVAILAMVWTIGAACAQGNYTIQPGDQLAIEILEDSSLNRQVLVLPDGTVSFPMAGSLRAGGQTTEQVSQLIASRIAGNFAVTPTVYVSVAGLAPKLTSDQPLNGFVVYLVREVNVPGPKSVEAGTTFLQLLSQSGGFTKFAATKRLQLRRTEDNGQQRLFKVNYKQISNGAKLTTDPVLREGDVILVPERRLFE